MGAIWALNAETIENRGNQTPPSGLFLKGGILQMNQDIDLWLDRARGANLDGNIS
jgi:hypothetical protein